MRGRQPQWPVAGGRCISRLAGRRRPPERGAALTVDPTGIEAYRPAQIARRVESAARDKAALPFVPLATLGVLAGAFIAFGALFSLSVLAGADPGHGPTRVLAGMAFALGLILVVVGGAELFTGNALLVMAWVDGVVTGTGLLRNWTIVFAANFAGALGIAVLASLSGLAEGEIGRSAARLAEAKFALGPVELFARAVLCNALVCLAVWLSLAARDVPGKVLAVLWPIAAFVALGFEHSVANMFLLPFGLLAGASGDTADVSRNLFWVTLGNVAGGGGGVALSYWAAYRRGAQE